MKKVLFILVATLVISTGATFSQTSGSYVPNQIMVMLKPGYNIDDLLTDLNNDGLAGQYRMNQQISKRYRIYLLEHDALLGDSKNLVYDIYKMDQVALAQLNHYIEERIAPDDPSYANQQWNMDNTGQTGGTVDADIDAPEAWNTTTGGVTPDGDTIVVAVVDGGVQATHPDLQNNMWKNYIELAGTAGVDDDGNGYIDDFNGWDAVGNDNAIPSNSHATHCAGIVGAQGNNATGVTGVNWNVKILNVKGSSGTESIVVLAYDYVASLRRLYNTTNGAAGAFVVATSNSFGVNLGMPASFPIWCAMYDTLGTLGILSAAAGPNANTNIDTQGDIPTTCPSNYLIAVTNTTNIDTKNGSCGYGPINMDIGAPGTNIYSTYTTSTYNTLTGTSMATPHVAGAIGLYWSANCLQFVQDYKTNPSAGALQMRNIVLNGVDVLSTLDTVTTSHGRLNLFKGVSSITGPAPTIVDNSGTLTSSYSGAGNQWYNQNGIIPGATNDTLVLTQGGSYYVVYTFMSGCTATSNTVVSTLGVEESAVNFSIYPNPTTERLTIDAGTPIKATIQIMDLTGRTVLNTKMNQTLQQIDVSGLADGVYVIKVEYGSKSITKKIIKH